MLDVVLKDRFVVKLCMSPRIAAGGTILYLGNGQRILMKLRVEKHDNASHNLHRSVGFVEQAFSMALCM